jgi:transcriptional regulator with XRE-family HTH domain
MTSHPIHDRRYQAVAARLRELREQRSLHQQAVADRLGRTQTFVSKYESGGRRLDLIELLDVLHALEADPHEFIDRVLQQEPMTALPRGE